MAHFRGRLLVVFVAIVGAVALAYMYFGRDEPRSDAPKIAIVYTAPIPVINEIIDGFKDTVRESFPDAVFVERHADAREEQYGSAVSAVLASRPTILAPITTPISRITVQEARGRTPVVFMGVTDPVGAGVARSIERPVLATGSSDLCPFDTLLTTVRQVMPNARTLGLPYDPTDQPAVFGRSQLQLIAGRHGFTIIDREVTSADELATAVGALAPRVDAVLIAADNMMMENPTIVVNAALQRGKPTFACDSASVEAGAVAGVSVNYRQIGQLAGALAVRVLRGARPGDLPVAVVRTGSVTVNLRGACLARINLSRPPAGATVINREYRCERIGVG
jgi:putative ABC transport system substrate-binding protein